MMSLKEHKRKYQLDQEEMEILEAFEKGKLKPIKLTEEERDRYRQAARNTLNKTKNVNLRISERGLMLIKRKAAEKGLPYQTLASSVLYQYGSDRLIEKK